MNRYAARHSVASRSRCSHSERLSNASKRHFAELRKSTNCRCIVERAHYLTDVGTTRTNQPGKVAFLLATLPGRANTVCRQKRPPVLSGPWCVRVVSVDYAARFPPSTHDRNKSHQPHADQSGEGGGGGDNGVAQQYEAVLSSSHKIQIAVPKAGISHCPYSLAPHATSDPSARIAKL